MKHLIVFYYIITFTAGFAAIISTLIIYFITKKKIAKYYLIFLILLTILIVTYTFYFYIFTIISYQNIYLEILFTMLFFLIDGALIYIIPYTLHLLIGKTFSGKKKVFFGSITLLPVIMLLIPYFAGGDQYKTFDLICYEFYSIYLNILYIEIIYIILLIIKNLKTIQDIEIRKILKTILILGIIFFPAFIVDGYWKIFQVKLKLFPRNFNLMPVFYFSWSIISLIYSIKDFFKKMDPFTNLSSINLSGEFIKNFEITERETEVLTMILRGMNYNEIGNKLFISAGTIKNYAYSIYKKTGVNSKIALINLINNFKLGSVKE